MKLFYYLAVVLLFAVASCGNVGTSGDQDENTHQGESLPVIASLPPLENGTAKLSEADFGTVIELTGKSHPVPQIFPVSATEIVVKDSLLILKNFNQRGNMVNLFTLPDFRFVTSLLPGGRGPMEFLYPHIIPTQEKDKLCYVYDSSMDKLFTVHADLSVSNHPVTLQKEGDFAQRQFSRVSDSSLFYVESTNKGKSIFQIDRKADSVTVSEYYNLAFSKAHKGWAAYIGDFGENRELNRLVYAYKYFKKILFLDTQTGHVKVIDFDEKPIEGRDNIGTLGPDNVTYYWGMTAGKEYVYLLYSGRTPLVVTRELDKGPGYIFVEQFDWNGNPVRKFRLDHWGYFGVDEVNQTIYQVAASLEDPILSYTMP